jgi:thiosulfate/3-mercaptopyruvate sulfurtransferase
MRSLSKHTTNADNLRSQIRDNSVRVIDVRRAEDYKKDHIPKSVNLPLAELLADDSPEKVLKITQNLGIDDQTPVVVYDDTFGALASRVAWTLQYLGHSDVSLLDMTYGQWKMLGLETDTIETIETNVAPKTHSVKIRPEILATADYLEKVKDGKNVVLIDNRERLNYLEQHIPGAINIPYRTLASEDRILKSKDDLKRLLKNRNISEGL